MQPPARNTALIANMPATERVDGKQHSNLGSRQCTGICSNGLRCQRPPTPGGTVCVIHGSRSPVAQLNAKRMLVSLVEPALALLHLAVTRCRFEKNDAGNRYCATHGEDGCPEWSVRANAAKALLDRGGFGPQAKITFETKSEDFSTLDNEQIAQELEHISRQLRANGEVNADSDTGLSIIDTVAIPDHTPVP